MKFIDHAKRVLEIEIDALINLKDHLDDRFSNACDILLNCEGKIIVIGLGKSGHIGNKLAATLASTGSSAFFVHAAEAAHGDLGMIDRNDVILALSNSGNTEEVISLLPMLKSLGVPIISMTNNPLSRLAQEADVNLELHVEKEACPLGLAPTASTTSTLALGDALAISLLIERGFKEKDFAFSHPSGSLGKRLSLTVERLMATDDRVPEVNASAMIQDAVVEISAKRLGMTTVVDDNGKLLGIYTDGDIRRTFEKKIDMTTTKVEEVMGTNPKTIHSSALAIDALALMREFKITALVVKDGDELAGIVHIHHLLEAGLG